MNYRLSARARQDLLDIYLHSEDLFGQSQADRYANLLTAAFQMLATFPRSAPVQSELLDVRIRRVGSHMVFYRVEDETVLILRVRHGREDWLNEDDEGGED